MRITSLPFLILSAIGAVAWGCNGATGGTPTTVDAAAGGMSTGGDTGAGASTGTGGATAEGGTVGAGGATSSGGSGGSAGSGGATTTVPTGGSRATGGNVATGGSVAGGGTTGSGGTTAAGGNTAMGGTALTGGTVTSGGTTGTGGRSATGGSQGKGGATSTGTGASGGSSGGLGGSPGIDGGTPAQGCTPPATYANLFVTLSGHTQQESDDRVSKAWSSLFNPGGSGTIYNNGSGSDESYVEDYYNGDVRTEGMSYGMMIAVQLNHQTEFDRLWTFAKNHMVKQSGGTISEITWSVSTSGGSNGKTGGAPDGDEYFAAALVFAHTRWGDTSGKFNYGTEAQAVLNLVRTKDFNASAHLVLFSAGANFVDGSYVLPAFYQTWACFDTANADFWNASVTAARNFFHKAADSSGVIPDHSGLDGTAQGGAGADAIRCVVNIMMDWNFYAADSWESTTYATAYGAHEKNQGASAQGFCDATLGFGLPAASGKPFVDKIWSANVPSHDYWNGVLYMLALLHVSGTFHLWY